MKYYFLINPVAGDSSEKQKLEEYIKSVCDGKVDYQIYHTTEKKDATRFTLEHKDESCCIFACGGDGTIHEVVNGAVNSNINVGIYPCGSGNDFVRNFKDAKNLEKLISQKSRKIDTIKVGDSYSVNVVNVGFDAAVNGAVDKYKKRFNVNTAYNISIVVNLLKKMNHKYKIYLDDELVEDGSFLLMSLGNGSYYGGGYKCAPRAKLDDGLIEFCAVRKVGRLTLSKLIKIYKEGTHLESEKFKKVIFYRQCRKVRIESERLFDVTLDGENIKTKVLEASIDPASLNVIYNDVA